MFWIGSLYKLVGVVSTISFLIVSTSLAIYGCMELSISFGIYGRMGLSYSLGIQGQMGLFYSLGVYGQMELIYSLGTQVLTDFYLGCYQLLLICYTLFTYSCSIYAILGFSFVVSLASPQLLLTPQRAGSYSFSIFLYTIFESILMHSFGLRSETSSPKIADYFFGLKIDLLGVLEREKRSLEDLLPGEEALLKRFSFYVDFSFLCYIPEGLVIVCNSIVDFQPYFRGLLKNFTSFSRLQRFFYTYTSASSIKSLLRKNDCLKAPFCDCWKLTIKL